MIAFRCCPNCGHEDFRRSVRRNGLEKLFGLVCLPWRCDWCGRRYFRPRWMRRVVAHSR
jgi:hypothetical protein